MVYWELSNLYLFCTVLENLVDNDVYPQPAAHTVIVGEMAKINQASHKGTEFPAH